MRKLWVSSVAMFIVGGVFVSQAVAKNQKSDSSLIPDQYIVVFKDASDIDPETAANELVKNQGLGHVGTYKHILKGFAATIPHNRLENVKNDPRVAYVSQDRIVSADAVRRPNQPAEKVSTGISRISATSSVSKGKGVNVAVLDTGIDFSHPDLSANILNKGTTCISGTTTASDDNGHGTHVAGIIAATDNTIGVIGTAPQAKLIPVKVLDKTSYGSWSSIICGIDWVTSVNTSNPGAIKVVNMSLSGSGSSDNDCGNTNGDALHAAICRSRDTGVTYIVAAGNSATDASTQVPAAYDDAVITVSALNDSDGISGGVGASTSYGSDDTFASFSNYGSVVDIAAPGVNIYSTWKGSTYTTVSGTSMAAPHVAGAAALYLASHPSALWTEVKSSLISLAELSGAGHTDPSALHPEPVVKANGL